MKTTINPDAQHQPNPNGSGLLTLPTRTARAVRHFGQRIGAFYRWTGRSPHEPLRRTILILVDPTAYAVWPRPRCNRGLSPLQKLARLYVKMLPQWNGPLPPETLILQANKERYRTRQKRAQQRQGQSDLEVSLSSDSLHNVKGVARRKLD